MGLVKVESEEGVTVYLHCLSWTLKNFIPLPAGTVVTVVGRIDRIESIFIQLNNVDLASGPMPPQKLLENS